MVPKVLWSISIKFVYVYNSRKFTFVHRTRWFTCARFFVNSGTYQRFSTFSQMPLSILTFAVYERLTRMPFISNQNILAIEDPLYRTNIPPKSLPLRLINRITCNLEDRCQKESSRHRSIKQQSNQRIEKFSRISISEFHWNVRIRFGTILIREQL